MKKIVASFIAGVLLATSASVFAEDISKIGKTIKSEFKVTLDGAELPVTAIGVDGSSYAPVRAIGEALGLAVDFENNTVLLNSEEGKLMDDTPSGQLAKLQDQRDRILIGIDTMNTLIAENTDEKIIKRFNELIAADQEKLAEVYQQIAELLEQYPELSE